jgi:hypothetical protein
MPVSCADGKFTGQIGCPGLASALTELDLVGAVIAASHQAADD